MPDDSPQTPRISVRDFKGLNERINLINEDIGELDILVNGIPKNGNTITKINGIRSLLYLGVPIWGIHQTQDSSRNVLIQTPNTLYRITEDELFDNVYTPTLSPVSANPGNLEEEEHMAYARIIHKENQGTAGGSLTNGAAFATMPWTHIVAQFNPDGSAAAFASIAASKIVLAAGNYRIRGARCFGIPSASNNVSAVFQLYNDTAAAALWNGLNNQFSHSSFVDVDKQNLWVEFGGYIALGGSTTIQGQGKIVGMGTSPYTSGMGIPMNLAGVPEIYGWVEIVKTS